MKLISCDPTPLEGHNRHVQSFGALEEWTYPFRYGADGRLEQLQLNSGITVSYGYDENGHRIFKKIGDDLIEAYFEDWVITPDTLYRPVHVENHLVGIFQNDQFIRLLADLRGSDISVKDGKLSLPTVYGERNERTPYSSVIDYASKGYDPHLQAYRMGARDYDPHLKRFLTPDPLFFEHPEKCIESPEECNLYGYAKQNPVSFVDPTGKNAWGIGIGAILGGGISAIAGYQAGLSGGDLAKVTAVGAVAGGLAGTGIGGVAAGAVLSYGANIGTQAIQGTGSLDHTSATISAGASVIGTVAGSVASSYLHVPTQVVGNSLANISQSLTRSDSIISNFVGGLAGGAADMIGQSLLPGSSTLSPMHSGSLGTDVQSSSSFSNFLNQNTISATPANAF